MGFSHRNRSCSDFFLARGSFKLKPQNVTLLAPFGLGLLKTVLIDSILSQSYRFWPELNGTKDAWHGHGYDGYLTTKTNCKNSHSKIPAEYFPAQWGGACIRFLQIISHSHPLCTLLLSLKEKENKALLFLLVLFQFVQFSFPFSKSSFRRHRLRRRRRQPGRPSPQPARVASATGTVVGRFI